MKWISSKLENLQFIQLMLLWKYFWDKTYIIHTHKKQINFLAFPRLFRCRTKLLHYRQLFINNTTKEKIVGVIYIIFYLFGIIFSHCFRLYLKFFLIIDEKNSRKKVFMKIRKQSARKKKNYVRDTQKTNKTAGIADKEGSTNKRADYKCLCKLRRNSLINEKRWSLKSREKVKNERGIRCGDFTRTVESCGFWSDKNALCSRGNE